MMEPLVSVTGLTYNHASYIKNALDGFLMQRANFPFEVILHDDASTDGTQDILREYERNYPDLFNIIYQKENQYSKTKSFVDIETKFIMPKIRGKYIASCEGDDYWFDPNKLQMQADYMEAHPKCSLCFHPVVWCDEGKGDRITSTSQFFAFEADFVGDDIIAPGTINVPTCSRMARTDIANEWPKFRRFADIGDLPAKFLLAANGYFHYIPKVMGVYRWNHPESWNHQYYGNRDFAMKNAIIGLRWLYEFYLYCKGAHVAAIGKVMMYQVVLRLDAIDAVKEFPWLEEIVIAAHSKKDKMVELKKVAEEKKSDKSAQKKLEDAEKEYYTWFVEAIGKGVNS